jgi:hypothetical protein
MKDLKFENTRGKLEKSLQDVLTGNRFLNRTATAQEIRAR